MNGYRGGGPTVQLDCESIIVLMFLWPAPVLDRPGEAQQLAVMVLDGTSLLSRNSELNKVRGNSKHAERVQRMQVNPFRLLDYFLRCRTLGPHGFALHVISRWRPEELLGPADKPAPFLVLSLQGSLHLGCEKERGNHSSR